MIYNSRFLVTFELEMKKSHSHICALIIVAIAIITSACASIGRPEGGPRDEMPPVYVSSNPGLGGLNVKNNKIEIKFNENIAIDDAANKVVISPAQKSMASIFAGGKSLIVELRDTLIPNTTYTLDFSDAIKDLNEGNILDGFAMDFSTGDNIDSLRISGMLFEARTLEPAQGMLVGAYSNLSDTAITTLPMERITKTNHLGQFTIRNLKPGTYRLFAINDINRDYHWDRTEDVAFYDVTVSPYATEISVTDTLRSSTDEDSLVTRQGVQYLPNDILMTWFNEGYKSQYLKDYSRNERNCIKFFFGAPSDTFPEITIINGVNKGKKLDQASILDYSATRDSLCYWIKDSALIAQDSILVEARFLRTDTLDNLSWGTDTLKLFFKEPKKKKEKKKKKEENDSINADSITKELTFLKFTVNSGGTQEINRPLIFTSSQPIDTIYQNGVHLEIQNDTLWNTVKAPRLEIIEPGKNLNFKSEYTWQPGAKYRLTIDSAAIVGIYNEWNKPIKHEFTVRPLEEYASLYFIIEGIDNGAIVELLNGSDKLVRTAPVIDGIATFEYLQPSTYYARLFIDRNNNGEYDTGNLLQKIQPEEVYYFSKKLNIKRNWEIEQNWNIYEFAIDAQKPEAIKKNKPKRKKGESDRRDTEEEEEDGYYDDDPFGSGNYNNRSNSNSNRNVGGPFRTNRNNF